MSARTRWRQSGAISVATTAALAAGLASTPAAAAVAPEAGQAAVTVSTPRTAGAFSVYVPQYGDTLFQISARFCGRGSYYPRLAAASGIVNPDQIYAGRTRVVLACAGATQKVSGASPAPVLKTGRDARIAKVTAFARAQVGKWYRWGTAGPNTYDCSGLTMASYARAGVRLSHASRVQRGQGRAVSLRALLPGDVLWRPGHVVMYLGDGKIVEAPHSGARVRTRAFRAAEWYGARRMI